MAYLGLVAATAAAVGTMQLYRNNHQIKVPNKYDIVAMVVTDGAETCLFHSFDRNGNETCDDIMFEPGTNQVWGRGGHFDTTDEKAKELETIRRSAARMRACHCIYVLDSQVANVKVVGDAAVLMINGKEAAKVRGTLSYADWAKVGLYNATGLLRFAYV